MHDLSPQNHSKSVMKHGGEPPFADGDCRTDWLDLSTGINPHAYPVPAMESAVWQDLPRKAELVELLSAARRYYCVPESMGIVAVPGTEAAINQLPRICSGALSIVEPTYSSHRTAWAANGRTMHSLDKLSADVGDSHFLVVNPNNPTGDVRDADDLLGIAHKLAPDRLLIVDEAFMDCDPTNSVVSQLTPELPVVVLKSFGKFFGLAGLRLGFVIGPVEMMRRLSGQFGEWCISGPALTIGCTAMNDRQWQDTMRIILRDNMDRLEALLPQRDQVIGRTDLFLTYRHSDAPALHRYLAARKIWTRCFSYEPSWLRIGLPGTDAGFDRLAMCLAEFEQHSGSA